MLNKSAYCCPQLRAFVHLGRDERTTPWSLFASRSLPLWNRIGSEMFRPSSNDQGQARVKKCGTTPSLAHAIGGVGVQIVRKLPRQIGRAPYQARFLGPRASTWTRVRARRSPTDDDGLFSRRINARRNKLGAGNLHERTACAGTTAAAAGPRSACHGWYSHTEGPY